MMLTKLFSNFFLPPGSRPFDQRDPDEGEGEAGQEEVNRPAYARIDKLPEDLTRSL